MINILITALGRLSSISFSRSLRDSDPNNDKYSLTDVINNIAPISTGSFEGLKTLEAIETVYESIRDE